MINKSACLTAVSACLVLLPASPARAATAAPAPVSLSMPAMTGPLAGNSAPKFLDPDVIKNSLGKIYVTGAITALGLTQSNAASSDHDSLADASNAQVFIQNTDGPVQFFIQAGAYSTPSLGTPYLRTGKTTDKTFGFLPQGYIKFVPNSSFSFQAGKLPTLFGAEYTFTFENMNIERGLLWNQENAVNKGVQANYTTGPWALSLSLNDGYYSNSYSWLSGSAAYTIDGSNTVSLVAGGNLGETTHTSFATPIAQNNSYIYNVIYTHTSGPWTVTPYLQYTYVPENAGIGIAATASTFGAAVLAKYSFDSNFSLTGRAEYISSTGNTTNLMYGPGSKAWSLTATPTYQYGRYFGRADVSYVHASGTTAGSALGPAGNDTSQARLVLETGVLF